MHSSIIHEAPRGLCPPASRGLWGSRDGLGCVISFFYQFLKCIFMRSYKINEAPWVASSPHKALAPPPCITGVWGSRDGLGYVMILLSSPKMHFHGARAPHHIIKVWGICDGHGCVISFLSSPTMQFHAQFYNPRSPPRRLLGT